MPEELKPVVLDPKKLEEMQTSAALLVEQAHDCTIANDDDFLVAGQLLERINNRVKAIEDFFAEPAKQAAAVHRFITGMRGTLTAKLAPAVGILKTRRSQYIDDEEKKRREIAEAAQKAAQEEAEQQAVLEAAQLEKIGETAAAATVIERAVLAPPPVVVVPSTIPKEAGHSFRMVHKYRVVNPAQVKREFLSVDDSKIGAIVTRLGPDAAGIVGGIEVYSERQEVIRRKA